MHFRKFLEKSGIVMKAGIGRSVKGIVIKSDFPLKRTLYKTTLNRVKQYLANK